MHELISGLSDEMMQSKNVKKSSAKNCNKSTSHHQQCQMACQRVLGCSVIVMTSM